MPNFRKLQNNLDYWDKEAPLGATHYAPKSRRWFKELRSGKWYCWFPNVELWVREDPGPLVTLVAKPENK